MSTLLHSPADIVARLLTDLGVGAEPSSTSVVSWPVYVGHEPSTPDNCITVYDTTEQGDGRSQISGEGFQHYGVQVRIRATSHAVGWIKADSIIEAMEQEVLLTLVYISGNLYRVQCIAKIGGALKLGKESPTSKRELFTVNAVVTITTVDTDPLTWSGLVAGWVSSVFAGFSENQNIQTWLSTVGSKTITFTNLGAGFTGVVKKTVGGYVKASSSGLITVTGTSNLTSVPSPASIVMVGKAWSAGTGEAGPIVAAADFNSYLWPFSGTVSAQAGIDNNVVATGVQQPSVQQVGILQKESGGWRFYLDGEDRTTTPGNVGNWVGGFDMPHTGGVNTGDLAGIFVFNRPLQVAEIAQLNYWSSTH